VAMGVHLSLCRCTSMTITEVYLVHFQINLGLPYCFVCTQENVRNLFWLTFALLLRIHCMCFFLQVPAEFKDVLDNTVVAALSHSSAHVWFSHNLCYSTCCRTIIFVKLTHYIRLNNHDRYVLLNCAFSTQHG
jgi:hypothetical protein